jgi:hypothetical protein
MAARGNKTVIMLTLSNVPPWVSRPVQLYMFAYAGRCARHEAAPAYALNDIVQAGLLSNSSAVGPITLEKTVPVSMNVVRASLYSIVVRTSPADGNIDINCGEMN